MASFQNINKVIIACLITPTFETDHCKITFVTWIDITFSEDFYSTF